MEEQAGNLANAVAIFKLNGQTGRTMAVNKPASSAPKVSDIAARRKPAASPAQHAHHAAAKSRAVKASGSDAEWNEF